MHVTEAIETRLEVREFADDPVSERTRERILQAARLAPSGRNLQHWRFVRLDDPADLDRLAEVSATGGWVRGADFAVVVLTDPTYNYHEIDAARAADYMQFAAWDDGVGSCIFTGIDDHEARSFLDAPDDYAVPLVIGFGHPTFDVEDVQGQKDRKPLSEVAFDGRFGQPLTFE